MLRNSTSKTLYVALFAVVSIGVGSLLTGDSAFAATKTFTGATNNTFNVAANWSPAGVPVNGDDIIINNSSVSTLSVANDIVGLTLNSITLTGTQSVQINSASVLTLNGPVTASSTGNGISTIMGDVTLSNSIVVTNVALAPADNIVLGGNTLTLKTDANYTPGIISLGRLSGAGAINIDVRNSVSLFLRSGSTYSGVTNLISGTATTSGADSSTVFGTSVINVSPSATLSLNATAASWAFANPINFQAAVVGSSGFLSAQLYIWTDQNDQAITIPGITLSGNARFDVNTSLGTNPVINLAGIAANGHCIQYGDSNNNASLFINGPSACVIGTEAAKIGVPNTAVNVVLGNPFVVMGLGVLTASVLAFLGLRRRSSAL